MKNDPKITICHQILDTQNQQSYGNLCLGGIGSLKPEIIEHFQISAVVTLLDSYMHEKYNINEKLLKNEIKSSKWIEIQDDEGEDIFPFFQSAHEFIDNNIKDKNVLVHCQAGVSRSATIVISYLMKSNNMTCQEATKFVRSRRYQISPNQGFSKALEQYEGYLKKYKKEKPQKPFGQCPFKDSTKFCQHILNYTSSKDKQKGNLFLGQLTSVLQPHILKNFQIKAILTILDQKKYQSMEVRQHCQKNQIEHHLWVCVDDRPQENLEIHFQKTSKFLFSQLTERNVLVHCLAGVSRSATIVIAFIMQHYNVSFEQGLTFVQKKREQVHPNQGFQKQLQMWQEKIKK